jgi:hypothetical protein
MLNLSPQMLMAAEARGGVRRPPDVEKVVGAAVVTIGCGLSQVAQAQAQVGQAVADLSAQVRASGEMQAATSRSAAEALAQAMARRGGFKFTINRGQNGLIESVEARPLAGD